MSKLIVDLAHLWKCPGGKLSTTVCHGPRRGNCPKQEHVSTLSV